MTRLTFTGCKHVESTQCEEATVEAIDLPWRTTLVAAAEGTTRETIAEDGKGAPGYKQVCKVLGVKSNGHVYRQHERAGESRRGRSR